MFSSILSHTKPTKRAHPCILKASCPTEGQVTFTGCLYAWLIFSSVRFFFLFLQQRSDVLAVSMSQFMINRSVVRPKLNPKNWEYDYKVSSCLNFKQLFKFHLSPPTPKWPILISTEVRSLMWKMSTFSYHSNIPSSPRFSMFSVASDFWEIF